MKQNCLLWMLVGMLLAGCGEITPENVDAPKPIALTKSQTAVVETGNDFAFNLLRETNKEAGGGNLFLSPMGVSIVASMLANGAAGQTYDEIVEAIGLKGYDLDQVNSCYATLVSSLSKVDSRVSLSLANSIWVAKDLTLHKKFRSNMEKTFDAESFSVDFSASGTLKKVNDWCSKKTQGLIPKMFDQLNPQVRMLLINALYFKGEWTMSFDKANTQEGDFQTISGTPVKVPFMWQKETLAIYQDKSVTLVKLPYGNGAFLMEALQPNGDFEEFLKSLSYEQLNSWDQAAQKDKVSLRFPKFKEEFDTDEMLKPVLSRLGMKQAFGGAANFSNMSDEPLFVSKFRQKSYVSIDEKGTEAAAVTVAEMRKNSASIGRAVNFDRPFVYLIRESSTGAILFIGTKVK